MDAMLSLMLEHDLHYSDIREVTLYAGRNILDPIRYAIARTELEAKFCMPFLLAAIMIARRAGKAEFTDEFVSSPVAQELQGKVKLVHDSEIEARGFDQIRSRLEVETVDGRRLVKDADEHYRGGPDNPLTDDALDAKFCDCASGLLSDNQATAVIEFVRHLASVANVTDVLTLLDDARSHLNMTAQPARAANS
jgi:2-methylcitrate dehydratase PrpD